MQAVSTLLTGMRACLKIKKGSGKGVCTSSACSHKKPKEKWAKSYPRKDEDWCTFRCGLERGGLDMGEVAAATSAEMPCTACATATSA